MEQLQNFLNNFDLTRLVYLLLSAVISLFCITMHELSHGFTAWKLGDPTAKNAGRLTLNPVRHLDAIGFLMMITVHIGWAKPVPVDMRYFRHPKRGMAIVALAGPAANLALAWLSLLLGSAVYHIMLVSDAAQSSIFLVYVLIFLCYSAVLNIGLGLFNLIPIPPLDGSKILFSFFPDRIYYTVLRYERYIMLLMLLLAWSGVFSTPLQWCIQHMLALLCTATGFPYGFAAYYFF